MNLDLREIQGLLASGYGGSAAARYLLAEVVEPFPAGRALLQLANLVTFADAVTRKEDTKIGTQVNVAFSAAGLTELGITPDAMADFSREFREGMVTTHRQRILGDLEGSPSDPVGWRWGGPSNPQVHVALLLFARDDQLLTTLTAGVTALLAGMRIVRTLETVRLADNREHFGFRDGISSPWVEGLHPPQSAPDRIAAGEIVLGLPDFSGVPEPYPPLGRNGSYLVMRQLAQDVEGFWAGLRGTVGDAYAVRWATKMTGRWPDGTPLAKSPDGPTADPTNDFGYRSDLDGLRCPVGAHIRRTNPRDSLTGDSTRSAELVSRHRLLRRGRSFGLPAAPDSWPAGIDPVMTQSHRADDSGRARHRVRLSRRQPRPTVRVRAAELVGEPEVRRPVRRERPDHGWATATRHARRGGLRVHRPGAGPEPSDRASRQVRVVHRRRVLLRPRAHGAARDLRCPVRRGADAMIDNANFSFTDVAALAVEACIAPIVVTSAEIDERLAPFYTRTRSIRGLVTTLAGVGERRQWPADVSFTDAAAMAGEQAIAAAGIDRADIGVIIDTSVSRARLEPSSAVTVHHLLGLGRRLPQLRRRQRLPRLRHRRCTSQGCSSTRARCDYALIVDGEGTRELYDNTIDRLNATGGGLADLLVQLRHVHARLGRRGDGARPSQRITPRATGCCAGSSVPRPSTTSCASAGSTAAPPTPRPARRRHRARRQTRGPAPAAARRGGRTTGTSSTRCPRCTRTRWPRSSASNPEKVPQDVPALRQHRTRGDPDHARPGHRRAQPWRHRSCAWGSVPD